MPPITTHGYLLSITPLSNNDASITLFTKKHGKISCFAKNYQNSQKRQSEIDFFRLLEIDLFQGRNNFQLRKARTIAVLHQFSHNFNTHQDGFKILKNIQTSTIEHHEEPEYWQIISEILLHYTEEFSQNFSTYALAQILEHLGFLPRFDHIRQDIYFSPSHGKISQNFFPDAIKITNLSRQTLEFLRRTPPEIFQEKHQNIPTENCQEAQKILQKIWTEHFGEN